MATEEFTVLWTITDIVNYEAGDKPEYSARVKRRKIRRILGQLDLTSKMFRCGKSLISPNKMYTIQAVVTKGANNRTFTY